MNLRLRHLADINPPTPEFDRLSPDDEVTFMPLETVWADSRVDMKRKRPKTEVSTGYTRFRNGDVVVPKVTPTFQAGRSAIAKGLLGGIGAGSTELHVLRPKLTVDARFLRYVVLSAPFLTEGVTAFQGVAGLQRVPDDFVRDFPVADIPLEEQRRIADFLDAETSRVDQLAQLRKKFRATLFGRFDSEVKAATGRLLAWGGSRSQALPVRRVVSRVKTGATPPSAGRNYFGENKAGVPWFAPASFVGGIQLGQPQKHLSSEAVADGVVPRFEPDSVLIVGIGATAGKVAYLDFPASGNQQITAIETNRLISSKFLAWQLWAAQSEILDLAPYTTLPIVNNDFLRSFPVHVPERRVQEDIVDRIELSWRHLADTGDAIKRQLDLLAERRQALITAAVTGQLDVTTARSGVR